MLLDNIYSRALKCTDNSNNFLLHLSAQEKIRYYVEESLSENTRKAIKNDLDHFKSWGGIIPAEPDMIAAYISNYAGILSVSTLKRRLAHISKAHKMKGYDNPVSSELVRMTMRGIVRAEDNRQRQAAPLLRDDLISICNMMSDDNKDVRDKALLMVGFAGALRRSELVALNISDVEFVSEGMTIHIRKSKTDQEGVGRKIAIPPARGRHCPVRSVRLWLEKIPEKEGALFRVMRKGGNIQDARLSDGAVSTIIKSRVKGIGLDEDSFSGHSLRAGCITSLAQMGIPEWQIMKQSGHKSHNVLMRYVRDARLFEDHPLDDLF